MSRLDIHVGGSFADTKRRVLDAVERAERGEAGAAENHISFESWEALTAVMTPRRFELLRHVHRHPEVSVAALSRALGRDYKRVHEDVEALVAAGLLDRPDGGVRAPFGEIGVLVAL
ncbi:MarR family transcriptional regulator [Roseomonas sp. BN140053]|uniref:HVO_A0114 family putative DNA-binding protein n=1 Tax=Roseomonas sp. BN140053 TaxID=3391898 RepID=UPI0039E7B758